MSQPGDAPVATRSAARARTVTLFLCGDVMTGRGIDQILPHPNKPHLYEPYVDSALEYVRLVEHAHGTIERPVEFTYIWGDTRAELDLMRPAARIINLETAVTTSEANLPGKGIHYRMHPANLPALTAAKIDCCVLANNHVLDWGESGLAETLAALSARGIRAAGAGLDSAQAAAPAIIETSAGGRVLIFAYGAETSGVPPRWAAGVQRAGVNFLDDLSRRSVDAIAARVGAVKAPGDIVIASIHWGANWGYKISAEERVFAHALIDSAGVDVVHGHSSHHVKAIEVYRDKLILYGCGDLLNDYEGIGGYASFRAELALMYFPTLNVDTGQLVRLTLTPTEIRRLRVQRAAPADARWLSALLNREGRPFGTRVEHDPRGRLSLRWANA